MESPKLFETVGKKVILDTTIDEENLTGTIVHLSKGFVLFRHPPGNEVWINSRFIQCIQVITQ